MGALRDKNGKVIGAVDTPGRGACILRTCTRSAMDRQRLGCEPRRSISFDEMAIDREDKQIADSAFARRLLKQCAGAMDTRDMHAIVDLLTSSGKLQATEAERLKKRL